MALQVNSVYYTGPRVRPERSGSVDQLDFQQRRQMIASSLSFSDLISGHKVSVNSKEIQQGAGADVEQGAKQNGDMVRGVPGPRSRTPPVERKHKFASLGRLFKPWKWKRKKKSDKFAETQRSLERKISVRANREDLIQKGILLPDTPTSAPPSANVGDAPDLLKERDHLNGAVKSSPHPSSHHHPPAYSASSHQEMAQSSSTAAAASQQQQASGGAVGPTPPPRPDRPASMGKSSGGRNSRWLICAPTTGAAATCAQSDSARPQGQGHDPTPGHGGAGGAAARLTPPPAGHSGSGADPSSSGPLGPPPAYPGQRAGSSSQRPVSLPSPHYRHTLPTTLPLRGDPGSSASTAEQRFSLSRLPDPPIAVTDIGPIPPPPMFSNGSSAPGGGVAVAAAAPGGAPEGGSVSVTTAAPLDLSDARFEDLEEEEVVCGDYDDDDEEYYPMAGIAGGRGDEPGPPPREPRLDLKPLKSALKRPRGAVPEPGSQSPMRPLAVRQDNQSAANFRFGSNKENAVAAAATSGEDSDDSDGPIPYRDEPADGDSGVLTRLGSRVQRTDSLALKLALRPDRQELIDRNIIHVTSEQDRTDWRSELAAKLNRRLSLRPTAEELEDRNILKKVSQEESMRDMEAKKATLLRKLSFRPTVEELKQRKVIHFNDYVDVTQAHEYDRRADKPWTRLTPRDKAMIRKELNDFKSSEMDVHEESRHLTRFHRP